MPEPYPESDDALTIFGHQAVAEALTANRHRVRRLFVARTRRGGWLPKLIGKARAAGIPVQYERREQLARRAGSEQHQNVVAELSVVRLETLEDLLSRQPSLLVLVDGVEDPRNLGALIRTAEGAGADALLVPARHTCGITPAVVRVSAGAALHLPICQISNVVRALQRLKAERFWVVGLDAQGSSGAAEIDPFLPLLVVVGGESRGLRPLVRRHCDFLVRLPMRGRVSSLNLAVAAGILLYDLQARKKNRS